MHMNPNITTSKLVDDLLYFWASSVNSDSTIYDHDMANEVVADYTDNPLSYSDGSPVGTEYRSNESGAVAGYQPLKPPHRRFYDNTTEGNN